MSVASALELHLRREELGALVDLLTTETKVETDAGRGTTPSLLEAVAVARIPDAGGRYRAASLASNRAPVRLTAAELLAEVDRTVGVRGGRGRLAAVRAWAARVGSSPDLGTVADAAELASAWVTAARAVLEPRRYLGLRGAACPKCGLRQVIALGNAGENVIEPALSADVRLGIVSCWADGCGAQWGADELYLLADVLDQQSVETLALRSE